MSQGFWSGFAYLNARGFLLLTRAYGAFYCSYTMRCCALRVELRLLQLLSPFFFVFHFFPLPTVLIIAEGHNGTPKVPLYLHWLVWLRRARWLL
jgi:hypothetical protein